MIYVFDREEQLQAILSNRKEGACPYWNADLKEVLGEEYTFTFTIPYTHMDAVQVQELCSVAVRDAEGYWQLFVVTEINEIHAGEIVKEVFCEHASMELLDDVIEMLDIDRDTVAQALPQLLSGTRWEAGTMSSKTDVFDLTVRFQSVRQALTLFAERWGVELRFYITITGKTICRFVDAVDQRGVNTGKRFEYRKDMTEVRRHIMADGVKTALYGFGGTLPDHPEAQDSEEPTLTYLNLLPAPQANPNSKDDLVSYTYSGTLAESTSSDIPSIQNVSHSFVITQSLGKGKVSRYMRINHSHLRTPITGGRTYTASVYAKANARKSVAFRMEYFDGVGKSVKVYTKQISISANRWTRLIVTGGAPANARTVMLELRLYNAVNGSTLKWAAGMLEDGKVAHGWVLSEKTAVTTLKNLLASTQVNPTATNHLLAYTVAGSVTAASLTDVPENVNGSTRSYRITLTAPNGSAQMGMNTTGQKTSITEDEDYTASVYAKVSSAGTVVLRVAFYDRRGVSLSYKVETRMALAAGEWVRMSVSGQAPKTAAYLSLDLAALNAPNGSTLQWAAAMLEIGDTLHNFVATEGAFSDTEDTTSVSETEVGGTDNEKPRINFASVVWTDEPTRTNLLPRNVANPVGVTDLGTSGATVTRSVISDGPLTETAIRATVTVASNTYITLRNTANKPAVTGATVYTASIYARSNAAGAQVRVRVYFYDNTGANLPTQLGDLVTLQADTWTRISATVTAPAGAVTSVVELYGANPVVGMTMDYANAQLEEGSNMTSWMHGGTTREQQPTNKPLGQVWVGSESARLAYGTKAVNGTKRHRFGIVTFNDITDPEELVAATWAALLEQSKPLIQYDVKVVDLARLLGLKAEQICVGDTVALIDTDLNLRLQARVIAYNYDVTLPESSEVKLGNFLPVYTKEMEKLQTAIQESVRDTMQNTDINTLLPEDVLRSGDVIPTDWLQGRIDALQNEVLAGVGTVQITDSGGILIVDDVENPQKALRLLAGTLALANSRDPVTGLFNWRTFGTAEGFLADLVETGFIRFNRARGGTLALGGTIVGTDAVTGENIYENGVLEVYDTEGNKRAELNGQTGGFEELFVGHLRAPNVITRNMNGDMLLWVNHATGDDDNDGLRSSTPFATIQAAIDSIPKYNEGVVEVIVDNNGGIGRVFSEPWLKIAGFYGEGRILLSLGKKNCMNGEIQVIGNMNEIYIGTSYGETFASADKAIINNANATSEVLWYSKNQYCTLYYVTVYGQKKTLYGARAHFTGLRVSDCEIYDVNTACLAATYGATLENIRSVGLSQRGLMAYDASIIAGSGTAPMGTNQNLYLSGGAICNVAFTYNAGAATPPVTPSVTSTWKATSTKSWYPQGGWASNYLYQGQRPTDPPIWEGYIFFDYAAIAAALKNADGTKRPITKVRLKLKRTDNTGDNTIRYPRIYTTMQTAASGIPSRTSSYTTSSTGFRWGEEKWITLPNSFGEALRDGTARGLALYRGSDQSNYMKFEATATLEITHG